jgi:hypothetical protein
MEELKINPGRLIFGLSRIGYTTSSALCDIIDNSVRASANKIHLIVKKEREDFSDQRKNNISQYVIIDNGLGMDDQGIRNALILGSSDADYEDSSLSKFGLGMKSAAFSQGDILEIISSKGGNEFNKFTLSLTEIISKDTYFATKSDLNDEDNKLITEFLLEGKGTIIRIKGIRKNNHPSVRNTITELKTKIGAIYYYFIENNGLEISINQDIKIEAFDPLFTMEADINGNLDENNWDGEEVKWIEKQQELTLDDELGIKIKIEITQLPYPPIFKFKEKGGDKRIREKYNIGSGNYGFYVYRNNRLISWASQLDGIMPLDQDFYSFRARLIIGDEADDFFNIDVKKSHITLSEEALQVINDFVWDAKAKSKLAWQSANIYRKSILNREPNELANIIINDFNQTELLPGDELISEEDALERMSLIKSDMIANLSDFAKMAFEDKGEVIDENNLTPEQKEYAITGDIKNPNLKKIFRVTSVLDNHLWEPYYDTDLGTCVRINKYHIFARLIYEKNSENIGLQIIFDLMLLQFAEAEVYAYKNIGKYKYEELMTILKEFRRICSDFLANMCRKLENDLPPNFKEND